MSEWCDAKTKKAFTASFACSNRQAQPASRASTLTQSIAFGICLSAILNIASSAIQPAQAKEQKSKNTTNSPQKSIGKNTPAVLRTITFPKDYSLGTVYVLPFKPNQLVAFTSTALSQAKAQGVVPIRHKGVVLLTGSYQLAANMAVLKTLKPNDIQVLDMYRCEIQNPDVAYIAGLKNLIGMQLDDTEIGDDALKLIGTMPNLTFLSLTSTQITGATLSYLVPLKKLRRLELARNLIDKKYLPELLKLPQIERLGLQCCKIDDRDLDVITKLKNLQTLSLTDDRNITDLGLKKISQLNNLVSLEIPHAQITTNGLRYLTKLNLKILGLRKAQFNESQLARIKKMFPKTNLSF